MARECEASRNTVTRVRSFDMRQASARERLATWPASRDAACIETPPRVKATSSGSRAMAGWAGGMGCYFGTHDFEREILDRQPARGARGPRADPQRLALAHPCGARRGDARRASRQGCDGGHRDSHEGRDHSGGRWVGYWLRNDRREDES